MRAGLCGKLEGVGALAKHDKKYAYLESKTSKHGPFHCARIQAEESLPNAHAARIQSSAQLAAVERRSTLSLSYFTARNAATNAELPSTLLLLLPFRSSTIYTLSRGGAYSTSPQLQLHLLLLYNKSNVFLTVIFRLSPRRNVLSLPSSVRIVRLRPFQQVRFTPAMERETLFSRFTQHGIVGISEKREERACISQAQVRPSLLKLETVYVLREEWLST